MSKQPPMSKMLPPRLMKTVLAVFALVFLMSCATPEFDKTVMMVNDKWSDPFHELCRGMGSVSLGKYKALVVSDEGALLEREVREIKPDMIVAFALQSMRKILDLRDIPIVLVTWFNPCDPPKNMAVAPVVVAPDKQMEVISRTLPEIRHVGLLYTEQYTPILAWELWDAAKTYDIRVTAVKVESEDEALAQTEKLSEKTDALLMIYDPVACNFKIRPKMHKIAAERKYPVISFGYPAGDSPDIDAVLSIVPSVYEVGINVTELGRRIFMGEAPHELPRIYAQNPKIRANIEVAKSTGVKLNRQELSLLSQRPMEYDLRNWKTFPYWPYHVIDTYPMVN